MKMILTGILLLSVTCAIAKVKKDKPEPAFKKGTITTTAAYVYSPYSRGWYESTNTFLLLADYQVSRNFNVSAKYLYLSQTSNTHYYKSFGGVQMQYKSREQANFFVFTANYCYLNRGRVSLSSGLGLGFGYSKHKADIIDSNGKPFTNYDGQKNGALDIRLIEAKVMLKNNFALYGSLGYGNLGLIAAGASYNFPTCPPPVINKKGKIQKPEPAFSKGAISLLATYGTLSIFAGDQNRYNEFPGNFGIDAQYQLSRKFNVGLHYGYVRWKGTSIYRHQGTNIVAARVQEAIRSNDLMATGTYNYMNSGKLSLGVGAAIGMGIQKDSFHSIDTAGRSLTYEDIPYGNKLVCDIRFVEAKVNLANGIGLYGCLGTRSAITVGLQVTFNNHKTYY